MNQTRFVFSTADELARGLSPFAPERVAFQAGRMLLGEVQACIRQESFALESTLSGRGYVSTLGEAKRRGFEVHLNYLWLGSAGLAVRRVRQRVRQGGHTVPEADIRRRYVRSLAHLVNDYLPLADEWWVWNNRKSPLVLLAKSQADDIEVVRKLFRL